MEKKNTLTAQQMQALNAIAYNLGDHISGIAFQAIRNASSVVGFDSPRDISAIILPDGVTRFNNRGNVEFCFRADIQADLNCFRKDTAARLTDEFNAVALHSNSPWRFSVTVFPYRLHQVWIAAETFYLGGVNC